MAEEDFDPYHKWLGIPPGEQPPNHYRLLGIEMFECDLEVIESAADQRMAHLRTFQSGKNAQLSQKLLNEVSKARVCLLKPDTKQAYDETLGIPESAKPDFSGVPPVQVDSNADYRKQSSALIPIVSIFSLLIIGVAAVFIALQFSDRGDETGQGDLASAEQTNSKSPDATGPNSTNEAQSPKLIKTENKGSVDQAKAGNLTPDSTNSKSKKRRPGPKKKNNARPKPNKDATTEQKPPKKSPEKSKEMDDKKGKENVPPKKGDAPLIIGTKSKKQKAEVVRSPIPSADRWKPFVNAVKRDFDIKDEMSRDAHFGLFVDLISNAGQEVRADRSYAMFNIAMDAARKLNHASGVDRYCHAFAKRFEFDEDEAKAVYLKTLMASVESKPHVVKLLVETQKRIKQCENDKKYALAISMLQSIVDLSAKAAGKDINRSHFEAWLTANQLLFKISEKLPQLEKLRKEEQLSPEQHRMLGTYECFVNQDWDAGLAHFEACEFKPIADVAKKAKQVNIANIRSIAEIADQWWVLSSKVSEEEHLFRGRAKYWYDEYEKLVNAAEISKKIQKRLEDLDVGIGLKRIPTARSPSHVILLDRQRELTPGATSEPEQILFPANGLIGIMSKENSLGNDNSRFRIVRIDSQTEVYDDEADDFIDHPAISRLGKLAWLRGRTGIIAFDQRVLASSDSNSTLNMKRLRGPHPIRAFDISEKGDVFALADKFILWWNPQQAWGNQPSSQRRPNQFDSPVPFIPSRLEIIPNSSSIALSNSRNLVKVNPVSKGITEIHAGAEINHYDFATNGNAFALALKNGIRFKSFKGGKNLFFQTSEPIKVEFFPNSRFLASLHKDYSVRIWDTAEKNEDYLIERYDAHDYLPTDFSISPDGSAMAVTDSTTLIKLFDVYYE